MTSYELGISIMRDVISANRREEPHYVAQRIMDELSKKRLTLKRFRASEELLRRFHAHCRHLGNMTGKGYSHYYNAAIDAAVKTEDWPVRILTRRVKLDTGDIVEVDIPIPASSTKVTNGALLAAYAVIQDEARRHDIDLPEDTQ